MGMYTEFNIGVSLLPDTPEQVINVLKYMLDEDVKWSAPEHPFFETDAWEFLFLGNSCYFDGDRHGSLRYDYLMGCYYLTVRSSIKNYCSEIEKFLDFIKPYLRTQGFLGYMWYEEYENPTLIYNTCENGIEFKHVN